MKYRSKPVEVEAVQLRWDTWSEMCEFVGVGSLAANKPEGVMLPDNKIGLLIPTLEGLMLGSEGDWVIKGTEGEFYPCKDSIFKRKYAACE